MQEKVIINTDSLTRLAIYLTGLKDGKGDLHPVGTVALDDLWNTIRYLKGDLGFTCPERDNK